MLLLVSLGHLSIFLKINQISFALYMDFLFLFVFVSICIFVPISVRILVRIGFPFGFPFRFPFGFPFQFLFGFPFGFSFGSDSLISLSYSMRTFSANSFGLFLKYFCLKLFLMFNLLQNLAPGT